MRSVNLGRWSRRVERLFNIKGGGGLLDVDQSIRVVLAIFSGNEDRYLEGWNRFCTASQQAGVAAQFAAEQIRNPVGSNTIAVFERITVQASAADNPNLSRGGPAPVVTDLTTSIAAAAPIDSRNAGNSAMVLSKQSLVAITDLSSGIQASGITGVQASFDYIQTIDQEYVVMPGQALRVCGQTAAASLIITWMWRERSLEASELT